MTAIAKFWDDSVVPTLVDYIRIPAKSPHFDHEWARHGHIDAAVKLAAEWCKRHAVSGMKLEVVRLADRTPVLFIDVPPNGNAGSSANVLIYGHLDKQPEMTGWRDGFGPWTPVIEGGKLYGRGGADDGYAVFCALAALRALQQEKRAHARVAILIECCEESGSYDLPAYLEALAPRIGTPDLVVGLDSGCGNYNQLWGTTSLRGLINGVLSVEVLTEGVHSGDASGVVPEGVRIARQLLERLDDAASGMVKPAAFHAQIPVERSEQAKRAAEVLGEQIWRRFPFVKGMQPMTSDLSDLVLNRTWRPKTALVLSLRLPPTVKAESAARQLQAILEADPPCGARVKFDYGQAATGWHAPPTAPWLTAAVDTSSIKN